MILRKKHHSKSGRNRESREDVYTDTPDGAVCTAPKRLLYDGEFREHYVYRGRLLPFVGCTERTPAFVWRQ